MIQMNNHQDGPIIIAGSIGSFSGLANNQEFGCTSIITLTPGVWLLELQMNGFTSIESKWIAIRSVSTMYGMENLYGRYGGRVFCSVRITQATSVNGTVFNYGGASSYTPHHNDHFTATFLG